MDIHVEEQLRTNVAGKASCSHMETLIISYRTLFRRHRLTWILDDNEKLRLTMCSPQFFRNLLAAFLNLIWSSLTFTGEKTSEVLWHTPLDCQRSFNQLITIGRHWGRSGGNNNTSEKSESEKEKRKVKSLNKEKGKSCPYVYLWHTEQRATDTALRTSRPIRMMRRGFYSCSLLEKKQRLGRLTSPEVTRCIPT